MHSESAVIVFDGECHFCSAWVRFVLQNDAQGAFRFVPRQSDAARRLLAAVGVVPDALGSIALISGRTVVTRSDAVLRIFARLAFPWCLVSWLVVIPHPLRDFAYAWVARNRYRLSSRRTQCRLVGPDESDRFLR